IRSGWLTIFNAINNPLLDFREHATPKPGDTFDKRTLAETFREGVLRIYFYPFHWINPVMGDGSVKSQAGTIIHELAHEELNAANFAYGASKCIALSLQNPYWSIHNADNWAWAAHI